jgi:hypothetical protein
MKTLKYNRLLSKELILIALALPYASLHKRDTHALSKIEKFLILRDTIITPSGIKYIDLKIGHGHVIQSGKFAKCQSIERAKDGTMVDSSASSTLIGNDLWSEALQKMKVGGERRIIFPRMELRSFDVKLLNVSLIDEDTIMRIDTTQKHDNFFDAKKESAASRKKTSKRERAQLAQELQQKIVEEEFKIAEYKAKVETIDNRMTVLIYSHGDIDQEEAIQNELNDLRTKKTFIKIELDVLEDQLKKDQDAAINIW